MNLPPVQAVIFDMDGLTLDTEPIYRASWLQAARELGYDLRDDFYSGLVGLSTEDCQALLLEELGRDFPLAEFRKRWEKIWHEHAKQHGVGVKPGAPELLDMLAARQIPRALATSSARRETRLGLGPLAERFQAIVTGEDVRRAKPAPDIFLLAAQRLGVAPAQCVVLEDSEPGAHAAHAANMAVIVVPDLRQPSPETAAIALAVCESLHQVRALLEAGGASGARDLKRETGSGGARKKLHFAPKPV
ncbi:MAG: HAD family phosphatase [Kiritimatiellae bacterium]|nr:HAD family phosphatase [Kiritimatiellia bacterium]